MAWSPGVKSSWNRQWTAAKRRSAALTLSGYFCTSSRTLLALPCAASMTSRLGLSCSVDWESSFSSTEMTVPEQRQSQKEREKRRCRGRMWKGNRGQKNYISFFHFNSNVAQALQKKKKKSHSNWLTNARMSQNVPACTGIWPHTFANTHQSVVSLP